MSQFMNLSSSDDESSSCASSSTDSDIVRAQDIENTIQFHQNDGNDRGNDDGDDGDDDDDDDDEFNNVDWEDADINEGSNHYEESTNPFRKDNVTSLQFPCKGISSELDIMASSSPPPSSQPESKTETKRKRKRKRQYQKLRNVSSQVQALVLNIYKAHMLCWTSRVIHISSCLSNLMTSSSTDLGLEICCVAHSLIPLDIIDGSHRISLLSMKNEDQQRGQRGKRHNHATTNIRQNQDLGKVIVIPPIGLLKRFCVWFFDFINHFSERRRRISESNIAAGAPSMLRRRSTRQRSFTRKTKNVKRRKGTVNGDDVPNVAIGHTIDKRVIHWKIKRLLYLLEHLSPTNDDRPNNDLESCVISSVEKNLILVCMIRSMGWRVRYVQPIDPMERDLTVHHPLFSLGIRNVLQNIVNGSSSSSTVKRRKRKRNSVKPGTACVETDLKAGSVHPENSCEDSLFTGDISWVEVRCVKDMKLSCQTTTKANNNRSTSKKSCWIHVDPHNELLDKPLVAESMFRQQKSDFNETRKSRSPKPLSFVLAVENFPNYTDETLHCSGEKNFATLRMTDVTPRYSNKWSLALRLRGATARDISKFGGRCSNVWWTETIKKANIFFGKSISHHGTKKLKAGKCHNTNGAVKATSGYVVEKSKDGRDILMIDDSSNEEKLDESNASNVEDADTMEEDELVACREGESIPTSKTAFKNHPLFVLRSTLKHQEVLSPDVKNRICGMFKGQMVFKRADVSKALAAKKWLYEGRKVKDDEMTRPAKIVKARKKPMKRGFQAIASYGATKSDQAVSIQHSGIVNDEESGDSRLYGVWQTDEWSPPLIKPNDAIPVNKHKNVELALLNPGLTHLKLYRIATIAKKLGLPYAPCLIGFEGHGGNRTPSIQGIVVHQHNADLLREAHKEWESEFVEIGYRKRQEEIYLRWRRIIMGIMTKDRLEREYAKD